MNILFLSIGRLDNINDRGIYTDLLRELRNRGHNIYVCSGRPKREGLPTECVVEDGVTFVRTKTGNLTESNKIEKGIATLMIEGQFKRAIKKHLKDVKFDLVLYSTPPITLKGVVEYIKKRDNAKTYLLLKDIFPQNAVDIGLMSKSSIIYKYFRSKEKSFYKLSDYIGCMSPSNIRFLLKHNDYIDKSKVEECPNSIEPIEINRSDEEKIATRNKYNIPTDKLAFVFGGNLGKIQAIDYLVDVMRSNKDNERIYFVVIGRGNQEWILDNYINEENPTNVLKLKTLPRDEYEAVAASCDVGLIITDKRFTIPNFPSRMLSYLQESMPVLCATDTSCDSGVIAEKGGFGYGCISDSVEAFNTLIPKFENPEDRKQMGKNGYKYLLENYTVKRAADIILRHF